MIASWLSGVHTATQVSGSLARTTPEENAARNLAGMLSRFFASSECSKWPRNAKSLSVAPHHGGGGKKSFGPQWRSGRRKKFWEQGGGGGRPPPTPVRDLSPPYPTSSHFATHFPTGSVRCRYRAARHGWFVALESRFGSPARGGTSTQNRARIHAATPTGCNPACNSA